VATTQDKGSIVEKIAAWLYEAPGVIVQRNARLPMLGSQGRTREIDVLLTTYIADHRVQLAIECKNEAGPIGAPRVDAFRGKLEAVGIPPSLGIYISARGYTRGALETARVAGIKALTLEGLSADRLSVEAAQAFRSVVVHLPDVTRVWLANDVEEPIDDVNEAFLFFDKTGQPAGTVQDFVWQAWQTGEMKPQVGRTVLPLEIPGGWYNVIAGRKQTVRFMSVVVDILALVMTDEGEAYVPTLVSTEGEGMVRYGLSATFRPLSGRYRLETFDTEESLHEFLASRGLVHIAHRIRSPRIRFWNTMFWPPSQRVADVIAEQMQAFENGEIPDPRPFSFEQLEGSDLSAVWEPNAEDYLAGLPKEEKTWRSA